MSIRLNYPDELGRAQSLLNGYPVPADANYLVWVKEQPVERIIAVIPSWKSKEELEGLASDTLRFFLTNLDKMDSVILGQILDNLEKIAESEGLTSLSYDTPLSDNNPLSNLLITKDYSIFHTDYIKSVPIEELKKSSLDSYQKIKTEIPSSWKIESIQGHSPGRIYSFISAESRITQEQFKNYWDTSNRERYEAKYSYILIEENKILGLILVSKRESQSLNVHVEMVNPEHSSQSILILASLRNAAFSNCSDTTPKIIFFHDSSIRENYQSGTITSKNYFRKTLTSFTPAS